MAVKCLTPAQKKLILFWYEKRMFNQKELAAKAGVSERTINRVLIEAGLATPVQRIKADAYQVMMLLRKYGVDYAMLNRILQDKF